MRSYHVAAGVGFTNVVLSVAQKLQIHFNGKHQLQLPWPVQNK